MLSRRPDPESDPPPKKERPLTITCCICQAIYAPREDQSRHTPPSSRSLEPAFMSMCHFCFRCRRPACPQCWDTVHGVCGECGLEAKLPFRAPAAPLRGVLFPVRRQAQLRRKRIDPVQLICIQTGRFQQIAPLEEAETRPIQTTLHAQPVHQTGTQHPAITRRLANPTTAQSDPAHSQENTARQQFRPAPARSPIPPARPRPTLPLPPHDQFPMISSPAPLLSSSQPSGPTGTHQHPPQPTPTLNHTVEDIETRPPRPAPTINIIAEEHPASRISVTRQIELILTWSLLSILIALIILIGTAFFSQDVNLFVLRTIHINIHDELTYLWQLLTHLHN